MTARDDPWRTGRLEVTQPLRECCGSPVRITRAVTIAATWGRSGNPPYAPDCARWWLGERYVTTTHSLYPDFGSSAQLSGANQRTNLQPPPEVRGHIGWGQETSAIRHRRSAGRASGCRRPPSPSDPRVMR